jgi:predicted porin
MRHRLAALILATCASSAVADTTIYGQVAAALRKTSNFDPAGQSSLELTGTNIGSGFVGFRGIEKIGNGLQVRFRLEAGYFTDNGAMRHNALFGREASVGIDGPFGKLDAGRLQIIGNASEVLVRADPLRGAGQIETVWPGIWTGARYDNAIRWRTSDGQPWVLSALYSNGESGATHAGRTLALAGGHLGGGGVTMAAYQVSRDASNKESRVFTLGGTIIKLPFTFHWAYLKARRDKGYVVGTTAGSALFNTDQGFAGIKAPADIDAEVVLLGLTAQLSQRWRLRTATFLGSSDGSTLFNAGKGGRQRSAYAMLSYDFSARTSLLLEADVNRWDGGWAGFWGASPASLAAYKPDGRDTRHTASIGLNHNF